MATQSMDNDYPCSEYVARTTRLYNNDMSARTWRIKFFHSSRMYCRSRFRQAALTSSGILLAVSCPGMPQYCNVTEMYSIATVLPISAACSKHQLSFFLSVLLLCQKSCREPAHGSSTAIIAFGIITRKGIDQQSIDNTVGYPMSKGSGLAHGMHFSCTTGMPLM